MSGSSAAPTVNSHKWLVRAIFAVTTLLLIVGIFAVWTDRQLLNTSYWADTNTKLLQNDAIRGQVAGYATDELFANVDVTGQLQAGLPARLAPLAAPAAAALRNLVEKGTDQALQRPRVQNLWRGANIVTHKQLVALIENRGKVVKLPGGGAVFLDLRPIVAGAAARAGLPPAVADKLPPSAAQIKIIQADQLTSLQKIVKGLKSLAVVLPILAVLLLMFAVWLAHGRRREALLTAGFVLVGSGLLVLVIRAIAGGQVVNELAKDAGVRPAVEAAWSIGTSVLADIAGAVIFVGIPVILAALLAGPSRIATRIRRWLAPYLAKSPELAYGVVTLLLLLLLWWGPIPATRRVGWMLFFSALAYFGMAMLRRQTAEEFGEQPEAAAVPPPAAAT